MCYYDDNMKRVDCWSEDCRKSAIYQDPRIKVGECRDGHNLSEDALLTRAAVEVKPKEPKKEETAKK
jgi:hypothetical protein